MKETDNQILTIKQFSQNFPWPTESGLRAMIQRADRLGLNEAFLRLGRRILVRPQVLFSIIENLNQKERNVCESNAQNLEKRR